MASHKRTFQCFDAIVDNCPPPKPSFPVGHRFGGSQKSSHSSTRLEPLEDHGSYICADHQQARPVTESQSTSWYQPQAQQHQHAHRRPTKPDGEPVEGATHHHRHSKRIVLVKNSDPSIQKTILLHRRTLRSLGVFLDDVSELMQCLIRKLYTLEGHKIDSIQSLLQCPSVLVCVGREPFHPLLMDSFRKNSEDKLPKLILKSRSSACNEEQGCKNVNFGLETKKSIIHPKTYPTDKSARLTMSSEKSFPSGLNSVPPGHPGLYSQARENMMDDDIEKRVHVNKDGSLSMEMKVRFRLLNDETLHWSTEIKKSSGTFNESFMGYNDAHYLQHSNSESCSEAESLSAGDADVARFHQKHSEEFHCQHCCTHCQEYDIWKNPAHGEQENLRHIRSSSSSASSHKIVCKKASVDSMHTMSSEEYTEQVVEKATCFQQTVGEQGDTTVEYCTISRNCSRSEVCSVSAKKTHAEGKVGTNENSQVSLDEEENIESTSTVPITDSNKDHLSVQITQKSQEEERPVSVESNSSQVLASLKEDQGEEQIPPSISRASQNTSQMGDEETRDITSRPHSGLSCKSPVSPKHQLSPRPPSNVSNCSGKSGSRRGQSPKFKAVEKEASKSNISEASNQPEEHVLNESDIQDMAVERAPSSTMIAKPENNFGDNAEPAETNQKERSSSAMSSRSNASGKSGKSKVNVVTEQENPEVSESLEERTASAMSAKSNISSKSRESKRSEVAPEETTDDKLQTEERAQSAMSNTSTRSKQSRVSEVAADEIVEADDQLEDRVPSAMSTVSVRSNTSRISESSDFKERGNQIRDRSPSAMSAKSNASVQSKKSNFSVGSKDIKPQERAHSSMSAKSNASAVSTKSKVSQKTAADTVEERDRGLDDRVPSPMSVKSNHSNISETATAVTCEDPKLHFEQKAESTGEEASEERPTSARSIKSNSSARSNKSSVSVAPVVADGIEDESEKRASTPMSSKSAASARSYKTKNTVSKCKDTEEKTDMLQERGPSVMSTKSHASDRSKSAADESADFEDAAEARSSSAMSIKSNTSTKTNKSKISECVADITEEEVSERSKSALSSISNASTKSKKSKMSVLTNEEPVLLESQTEDRAPSALSVKSNTSERSTKSNASEIRNKQNTDAEERSASAMTSKSNVSERSVKSNVSELTHDDHDGMEDHTEQRVASAMSAKSYASEKSGSNISTVEIVENLCIEQKDSGAMAEESNHSSKQTSGSNKENVERVMSSLSMKSNKSTKSDVSAKSNKSKVSQSASEQPECMDEDQGKRASSALSARSNVSIKSNHSKVSSVMSAKSNTSVKSKKSTVSDIQCENVDAETCQTGERSQSALSVGTNASVRSITSKASETTGKELGDEDKEERTLSAMSCKSSVSTTSNRSKVSDTVPLESAEINNDIEERAQSTTSAKSNISAKSKISEASEEALKKTGTTGGERKEDIMSPCSLSARSNVSASSRKSKISKNGLKDPEDEDEGKSKGASGAASPARSKKSETSEIAPTDSAAEDQTEMRTHSALSAKSNISTRSKMSRGSDTSLRVKEEETVERSSSAMSAKSNSSVTSKKSKLSEVQSEKAALEEGQVEERAPSTASIRSGISAKHEKSTQTTSSVDADPAKSGEAEEMKAGERALSPMSPKSKVSSRSTKSKCSALAIEQATDLNERSASALSVGSVKSKKSQNSQRTADQPAQKEDSDERNPSALSIQSNTSAEVGPHVERAASFKSNISAKSGTSDNQTEGSIQMQEHLSRAKSQLSAKSNISTKSKKSKTEEKKDNSDNPEDTASNNAEMSDNRVQSALSDHSKAPSSVKCVCGGLKKSKPSTKSSANKADNEERSASALSQKSADSDSERDLTPASASVSIGIVEEYDVDNIEEESGSVASVTRVPHLKSTNDVNFEDSSNILEKTKQQRTPSPHDRLKSSLSAGTNISNKSKKSQCTQSSSAQPVSDTASGINYETASDKSVTKNEMETKSDSHLTKPKSPTSEVRSSSKTSNVSHSKERKPSVNDRPKSNTSNSSAHLEIKVQHTNVDSKSETSNKESKRSNHTSNRPAEEDKEDKISRSRSAASDNRLSPSPSKSPKKSKKPVILLGGSNDSVLSQSVSAPEQLNENSNNLNMAGDSSDRTNVSDRACNCPLDVTHYGRNISDKTSEKSSKCRHRKGSSSSQQKADDEMCDIVPANLPNASPTEVVNEWLNKIPLDSALYDDGDEFHEHSEELETMNRLQEPTQNDIRNESEGDVDVVAIEPQNEKEAQLLTEEIENNEDKEDDVGTGTDKDLVAGINQSCPEQDVSNSFHSSVQVMRVLLSPKLDRCNSLPEVSTVYGQKLSTSARGLLDCLVNLQLIHFDPNDVNGKAEKYKDLMDMLQSLWLSDPTDKMTVTQKSKSNDQQSIDDEMKAKSSSGVDVSSGSTGSGKSSVNDSTQAQKSHANTEGEGHETLTKLQEYDETEGEEALGVVEMKSDPATPDIASRVQWSPETEAEGTAEERQKESNIPASDDTIRSNDSPREPLETPPSSNKSAGNDLQEDTSSGTPPSVQRAHLTKKFSQDPDPVWVLNLLNKLQKQFMTHYVNAMAEFKVRWNLNDNEQLDDMISELRDEVHKRIQLSIERELRKIQGRAGRPKPPKEAMSRESTVQTEQRRRRLKVMLNHSIDAAAKSDDDNTATGTDFSDQRSDDEYCPCDTCMKKKMASRPLLPAEVLNSAPVMMDFDLRKILQKKREAPTNSKNYILEETGNEELNTELEHGPNVTEDDNSVKDINEAKQEIQTCLPVQDEEIAEQVSAGMETVDDPEAEATGDEEKDQLAESEGSLKSETHRNKHTETTEGNGTPEVVKGGEEEENDNKSVEEQEAEVEMGEDEATEAEIAESEATKELTAEEEEDDGETEEKEAAETETGKTPSVETADEEEEAKHEATEEKESLKDEIGEEEEAPEKDGDESAEEKYTSKEEGTGDETDDGAADEERSSKIANGGDTTGDESAKEFNPAEDEITKDGETSDNGEPTKLETSVEEETADETAEDIQRDNSETADDGETADDEIPEDGETTNDEMARDEKTSKAEITDSRERMDDMTVMAGDGTSVDDESAAEREAAETADEETPEDLETNDDKTPENGETSNDEIAEVEDVTKVGGDDEDTAGEETTEDGETVDAEVAKVESAEGGETSDEDTPEEEETANDETAHDGETSKTDLAEEVERTDETENEKSSVNGTTEDREIADDGTAEDADIADDGTADDGEKADDGTEEDAEIADGGTAENGETADDGTAEDGETGDDGTAEDGETGDDGTAEDTKAADDVIAEDGETGDDGKAEDGEIADDGEAEDGEAADDGTAEDGETADDGTAEDGETADDGTAEDGQTSDDGTAEDGEAVDGGTAEDGETADDETAEDGETADDGTAEDGETVDDGTAEDGEAVDGRTAEDGETADDGTAEDGEAVDDGTAEDAETADDGTAEDGEAVDDGTAEDGETADDGTAEDGEAVDDGTAEDAETADGGTAEDGETADDGTAEDAETAEDGTAEDGEAVDDGTAEDGETVDDGTAEDGETVDDGTAEDAETADDGTAEDGEAVDDGTAEDAETADDGTAEDGEAVDDGTAEDGETVDDGTAEDAETADDGTAEDGEAVEDGTAEDAGTADDGTAEDGETVDGGTAEDGETADDGTAEDEEEANVGTGEDGETANYETSKHGGTSDNETPGEGEEMEESDTAEGEERGKEEAGVTGKDQIDGPDVNSSVENTEDHDEVTELKADDEADDEHAPLKNEGDVVVHSIEEHTNDEESKGEPTDNAQAEESSELMSDSQDKGYPNALEKHNEKGGYLNSHFVNVGESAEGGDEAEDETEPDVQTDEEEQTIPAGQSQVGSVQEDDQTDETTMVSFDAVEKICTGSEDGADADVEDSETEVHNKYDVDNKHNSDSVTTEKKETESQAKLSDIAEVTGEDENEDTTKQDPDCEEESPGDETNNLTRQITKSSMESQPGSLEEVLDEETRSHKSSDHLTVKGNCMYPNITSEEESKDTQEKSESESIDLGRNAASPKKHAKQSSKLKNIK